MTRYFRLSFRLLDSHYHGRGDGEATEWPPSPLRAFQAMVASAGQNARGAREFPAEVQQALGWLEGLKQPELIVAPDCRPTDSGYRLYVPNNHADVVAAGWKGGNHHASVAEHRIEKDVQSVRLMDSDTGHTIHYLWPAGPEAAGVVRTLCGIARGVTHLGWGIDMVAADAGVVTADTADRLTGHRWRPVDSGGVPLRVPKEKTLTALCDRYSAFRGRLTHDGFRPVPPLSCFDIVSYHSPTVPGLELPKRPLAVFEIHRTISAQENLPAGKSKFRTFHAVRQTATVAGLMRHATATVARQAGWLPEDITRRVLGHGDKKDGQSTSDDRLLFLPLPSITPVGVGGIRRVMVVGPPGFDLSSLSRRLNGYELVARDTCRPVAMLSYVASTDKKVAWFTRPAPVWSTVTPVILPGFDDPDGLRRKLRGRVNADEKQRLLTRLDTRTLGLIWKAFEQAGWSADALAGAELEYHNVGFRPGLDLAHKYELPPLHYPRYHVRVRFPHPVAGPLAVGAGRYRGLGLFAVEDVP